MIESTDFIPGIMLWVGILLLRVNDYHSDKPLNTLVKVTDKIVGLFFLTVGIILSVDQFILN